MRFYDSAQKKIIDFDSAQQPVGIYVCGITPYDAAHMGHIFTFMTYDLLQRRLEDSGVKVRMVRNVTDVDDPIFARALETGEDYRQLADRETKRLQAVTKALNFRQPSAEPLASQYIEQMAKATAQLLRDGFAYKLDSDIYFDTAKRQKFGAFSGFSKRLQHNFMADRGGDLKRPGKRQPLDFLLWKGIDDPSDYAAWHTALGRGRPGWHIECSVMSSSLLRTPIDIHGGGMDLIFPHHECEIAQSESLGQQPFSRHWLHVAPLFYHGEKMSKSLGNLVFAHELLQTHSPAVMRLALMQYHYRVGGEWRLQALVEAKRLALLLQKALDHRGGIDATPYVARIRSALDNDLDTHAVLHTLHEMAAGILASDSRHPCCQPELRQTLQLLGLVADLDDTPIRLLQGHGRVG